MKKLSARGRASVKTALRKKTILGTEIDTIGPLFTPNEIGSGGELEPRKQVDQQSHTHNLHWIQSTHATRHVQHNRRHSLEIHTRSLMCLNSQLLS